MWYMSLIYYLQLIELYVIIYINRFPAGISAEFLNKLPSRALFYFCILEMSYNSFSSPGLNISTSTGQSCLKSQGFTDIAGNDP